MPANVLYHYVSSLTTADEKWAITKKTSKYCIVDIVEKPAITFLDAEKEYRLSDHHISVYHDQDKKGQYHYTAYYQNQVSGESYQAHVYFDEKDIRIGEPEFSILSGDGSYSPIAAGTLNTFFIDLANLHCSQIIRSLRAGLKKRILELKQEYSRIEQELAALSAITPINYPEWDEKFNSASRVIEKLSPLIQDDRYNKSYILMQRVKASIEKDSNALDAEAVSTELAAVDDDVSEKAAAVLPLVKRAQSPRIESLDDKISVLCGKYASLLPETTDEVLIPDLVRILNELYEISLCIDDSRYSASKESVIQLQKLHLELNLRLETAYLRILRAQKFLLLTELKSFDSLISFELLNEALETNNLRLLGYILKHGDFDLDFQPVIVAGTPYQTAVHYCYATNNVDCLRLLIQYDASILVPDEAGLPIANTLLSEDTHPLKEALLRPPTVYKKVLGSASFYKQLIEILTKYADTPYLDEGVRSKIRTDIHTYESRVRLLLSSQSPSSAQASVVSDIAKEVIKLGLPVTEVQRDPLFQALVAQYNQENQAYKSLLSGNQTDTRAWRNYQLQTKGFLAQIPAALSKAEKGLPFEIAREQACEYIQLCINVTRMRIQLQKLENTISGGNGTIGTVGKKFRGIIRARDELVMQINILERSISQELSFSGASDSARPQTPNLAKVLSHLEDVSAALSGCHDFIDSVSSAKPI